MTGNAAHNFVQCGPFQLTALLGWGAFASVYRATDLSGRVVAIKLLQASTRGVSEPNREVTLAGHLSRCPNIVAPEGVLRVGERIGLVMPYVPGWTLKEIWTKVQASEVNDVMPPSVVLDIMEQMLQGLAFAHGLKINGTHQYLVHRDLKPANILVGRDGVVRILDFGLASVLHHEEDESDGERVGTPMYLAPEMVRRERVGPQADLFAVGTIFYELVTGLRAFGRIIPSTAVFKDRERQVYQEILKVDPDDDPETVKKLGLVARRLPGSEEFLRRTWQQQTSVRETSVVSLLGAMRLLKERTAGPRLVEWLTGLRSVLRNEVADGFFGRSGPPIFDPQANVTYTPALRAEDRRSSMSDTGGDELPSIQVEALTPLKTQDAPAVGMREAPTMDACPVAVPFGPYRLLALIGSGGYGRVYLAEDRQGNRLVLKVLLPDLSGDSSAERSLRTEAGIGALFRSQPSEWVARVYPMERIGGHPCLPMDFIPGWTGEQLLKHAPDLSGEDWLRAVLDLVIQVTMGLRDIHNLTLEGYSAGVVHRDLKPENLMVRPDGRVLILDFGISLADEEVRGSEKTMAGMTRGTPGFMSPEQVGGGLLTQQADLFAMGTIICALLNKGKSPFDGGTVQQVLMAVLQVDPERTSGLVREVSSPLAKVVKKCHTKELTGRYARAEDLLADLAQVALDLGDVEGALARFVEKNKLFLPGPVQPGDWKRTEPPKPVVSGDTHTVLFESVSPDVSVDAPTDRHPNSLDPIPVEGGSRGNGGRSGTREHYSFGDSYPDDRLDAQERRVGILAILFGVVVLLVGLGFFVVKNWIAEQKPIVVYVTPDPVPTPVVATPSPTPVPTSTPAPTERPVSRPRVTPSAKPVVATPTPTPQAPVAVVDTKPGRLSVSANRQGKVFLDGVEIGSTPIAAHEVSSGPHALRVVCDECSTPTEKEYTIQVLPDKSVVRTATF